MPAPVCATSPVTIAVNVVNPGAVNTRSFPSTASSDAGTVGLVGIGFPSPGAVATAPMLPTIRPAAGGNNRTVTRPSGNRCSAPAPDRYQRGPNKPRRRDGCSGKATSKWKPSSPTARRSVRNTASGSS